MFTRIALLLVLGGCSSSHGMPGDGADGGVATDAPPATDAPVTEDAPIDVDAGDPPIDAGACFDDPAVVGADSRAMVRFHVRGTGYLVTRGWQCGAMTIDGLVLGLPFQCLCECPNPGDARPEALATLDATTPVEVTWDGRSLRTWTTCWDCAAHGWPGLGVFRAVQAASVPVDAGRYRATFVALDTPPMGCSDAGDGTWSCFGGAGFPGSPPSSYGLCPGARMASVEFDLPASGETTVDVAL